MTRIRLTPALALVALAALMPALPAAAAAQEKPKPETAVFAGGCFWGIDAVFRHVKGVTKVVSGFSGGTAKSPSYEQVSEGDSGHAESVQVTFDPAVVPYSTLVKVFFAVHDPTELNRQGPDEGTQYRSAIFFKTPDQENVARAAIAELTQAKAYRRPIVTEVAAFKAFYPAEDYHQNYLAQHMTQPYIVYNDLPKLDFLKRKFPELYKP